MEVTSWYNIASLLCLNNQSQNIAQQTPCPGSLRPYLWLWDWLQLRHFPVSKNETPRLPISPSYLCSIWYEVQAECLPRKDAKKSRLQAVSQPMAPAWHQQCRAAAWSSCSSACRHHQHSPSPWQGTGVARVPVWPCSSLLALRLVVLVCRELMMKKQSRRSLNPQRHFEKNSMFPLFFLQLRSQASLNESSCWLYS